jgi:hypothetical protein
MLVSQATPYDFSFSWATVVFTGYFRRPKSVKTAQMLVGSLRGLERKMKTDSDDDVF